MSGRVARTESSRKIALRTPVPGPRSRTLREAEDRNLAPGLQGFALLAGIVVDHAAGSTITDVDGNTLLDLIGAIGVNGLGHSHPKWVRAVQQQAVNASVGSFTSRARVDLLERLATHRPAPDLYRAQLYSGGAEAVESALRLAKNATGKSEFVGFSGGFHGKTIGTLSLTGSAARYRLEPPVPGNHTVPYADCYRCPLALRHPSCGLACVDTARRQLKSEVGDGIAAFLVEPMQGTAGNVIPPPEWLPAVADLAREFDALLIADEMITGFGRTGRYWGIEHSGTTPDIVTIGKQMGGGFPISAVMARDGVVEARPWADPSGSSSSYGGNPLASAAAAATLRIIDEEALVDNAREVGAYFLSLLQPFVERYPFVGDVRGVGLLIGIELVRDKRTREPLSRIEARRVFDAAFRRGLLTMAYAPNFRIQPAMTIDRATVEEAVAILTEAFDQLASEGLGRSDP